MTTESQFNKCRGKCFNTGECTPDCPEYPAGKGVVMSEENTNTGKSCKNCLYDNTTESCDGCYFYEHWQPVRPTKSVSSISTLEQQLAEKDKEIERLKTALSELLEIIQGCKPHFENTGLSCLDDCNGGIELITKVLGKEVE